MDRRDFIKAAALAGAALTVKKSGAMDIITRAADTLGSALPAGSKYDLVAVKGGEPVVMFKKAIAELGGMKAFVKKGQKVCVHPNIGWDKTPTLAGNTNPDLVAEIVKQCLSAGAKEVVVFDHTCDDWVKSYANSGIKAAVEKSGGKMMPAHQESYYRTVQLPNGKILKSAKIHQAVLDSDLWINVPILKNHEGANLTMAMKNHMGIVWDRGVFHRQGLQQCIADVCSLQKKAVLNVVDAYRVMITNGPRGRNASDVVLAKSLFLSPDIVAVDTVAAKFFNQLREMPLDHVQHIKNAADMKLGNMNTDTLKVKKIEI